MLNIYPCSCLSVYLTTCFSTSAKHPVMREPGKGQCWEAMYLTLDTSIPTSSATSLRTVSSKLSPGRQNKVIFILLHLVPL